MLTPDDRRAIQGLFDRLAEAGRSNPERDPEAEQLIDSEMARQPGAPYYMAQTIVVQQQALEAAEQRILELEAKVAQRARGGLFGGLFDDGRGQQNTPAQRQVAAGRGPWDRAEDAPRQRAGGGGFLGGAAQTALGVAGGVLLGSAIGSLLSGGSAQAAEASNEQPDQGADDPGADDAGGDDFGGGDFGDGGGFDMGGDF